MPRRRPAGMAKALCRHLGAVRLVLGRAYMPAQTLGQQRQLRASDVVYIYLCGILYPQIYLCRLRSHSRPASALAREAPPLAQRCRPRHRPYRDERHVVGCPCRAIYNRRRACRCRSRQSPRGFRRHDYSPDIRPACRHIRQ